MEAIAYGILQKEHDMYLLSPKLPKKHCKNYIWHGKGLKKVIGNKEIPFLLLANIKR